MGINELNGDMNEREYDREDEDTASIIINTHLDTMAYLGGHIFELSLPHFEPLPTMEDVENGCDASQHFQHFLKVWGNASVGSFNFLTCGCLVYWSNSACFIRPCRDQHTEPIKDLSAKMYAQAPEHYGNTDIHPVAFENFGKIAVDDSLLHQLFNMDDFNGRT